ncbi:hypothetical protein [Methylobacterium sp. J-076]|uniref:hypothetical protein n=1 Tax=Methylobacterium sp. J-076 TaxID=2836655 RepID=UPI001FB999A3|nr:hypothetical protein [Methylobacterium sp. J-076]MCJ2011281.1 hypothetical protein [Methylobacterium sp. J-076]
MPFANPFRRQTETPTLRQRAADLKAGLANAMRRPAPQASAEPDPAPTDDVEVIAEIEFGAYDLNTPIKTPQEWADAFAERAVMLHLADRTLRMTKPETMAFIRDAGEKDPTLPEVILRGLDAAQATLEGWSNLLGLARTRYIVAASAECVETTADEKPPASASVEPFADEAITTAKADVATYASEAASLPSGSIDFGPDAPIAELAVEFCRVYADHTKADQAFMAGTLSEEEWQPRYDATVALMEQLEATEPRTLLGMALKCLGPIGAAAWDVAVEGDKSRLDRWERTGVQFQKAVTAGTLAPPSSVEPRPLDLIAAAGLNLKEMSVRDLASLLGAASVLEGTATAILCQPRSLTGRQVSKECFTSSGRVIEALSDTLCGVLDAATRELRGREPTNESENNARLAAIAEATIYNGDAAEIAAFARELLALVEA